MPATATRIRRTQEERSHDTRARILDAALECLATLGYGGTTTTVVAERAGVSRGAQLHHFPTRSDLIGAAVQHLYAGLTDDYARTFAALAPSADRVGAGIDLLWANYADPRLVAVLELLVAARTDAELAAALAPVAQRHHANVLALAGRLFPAAAGDPGFEGLIELVLDTLQGMAVRRLLITDDASTARSLAHVKQVAARFIRERGRPAPRLTPRRTRGRS